MYKIHNISAACVISNMNAPIAWLYFDYVSIIISDCKAIVATVLLMALK